MADSRFFPAVVALLNSLRIVGHEEPLTILDCGLKPEERDLLEPHASIVDNTSGLFASFARWWAPMHDPADVMLHLDADMVVVRSLEPMLESAALGRICAFRSPEVNRFFPEWQAALGLGPLVRHPHVQAGVISFPRDPGLRLMERMTELVQTLDLSQSRWGGSGGQGKRWPFYFGDQDVMNALFAAELTDDALTMLDSELMAHPRLSAAAVRDAATLECRLADGRPPYVLHAGPKQWVEPTLPTAYTALLTRLLFADDVAIRLRPADFPFVLRPGVAPALVRSARVGRARTARRMRATASLARAGLENPGEIAPFLGRRIAGLGRKARRGR